MKKSTLISLGLLSMAATGSAWAATTPSLPTLQAYTVQKNLLAYDLTPSEYNLVQRLLQQGNKNHVVLVDSKNNVLNTLRAGEHGFQLILSGKFKSVHLAEQMGQSKVFYALTQPLNVNNVSAYPERLVQRSSQYQAVSTMEVRTNLSDLKGSCGKDDSNPCPLYANGVLMAPIQIDYNVQEPADPPPATDFDPADFSPSNLIFKDREGNVIPVDGGWNAEGIAIYNSTPGVYRYGYIPVKQSRLNNVTKKSEPSTPGEKSSDNPINQFYVVFKDDSKNIDQLRYISAQVTPPGGTVTVFSSGSQRPSVCLKDVAPYPYKASDFVLHVLHTGPVTNPNIYQTYNFGNIGISTTLDPADHLGMFTAASEGFHNQNFIGSRYGWLVGLPDIADAAIFKLTDSDEYQDSQWNNASVYYSASVIPDPNNSGASVLPFYEIHTTMGSGANVTVCTKISGRDVFGNPFDLTLPVQIVNGKLVQPFTDGSPKCSNG